MKDAKYANEEALADPRKLQETLAHWVPLSSSLSRPLLCYREPESLTSFRG